MAQSKDVVAHAAAIGMVDSDVEIGVMVEQAVDDMGSLTRRSRQKLGVERREPVGDMGVDRNRRISTVAGIDAANRLAWAADMEVLAI